MFGLLGVRRRSRAWTEKSASIALPQQMLRLAGKTPKKTKELKTAPQQMLQPRPQGGSGTSTTIIAANRASSRSRGSAELRNPQFAERPSVKAGVGLRHFPQRKHRRRVAGAHAANNNSSGHFAIPTRKGQHASALASSASLPLPITRSRSPVSGAPTLGPPETGLALPRPLRPRPGDDDRRGAAIRLTVRETRLSSP
jgi:hypothetical protein